MNSTALRVPLIAGLPARISESMMMRSDSHIHNLQCPEPLKRFVSPSDWAPNPGQRNQCNKKSSSLPHKIAAIQRPAGQMSARRRIIEAISGHSGLRSSTVGALLNITPVVRGFKKSPEVIDSQRFTQTNPRMFEALLPRAEEGSAILRGERKAAGRFDGGFSRDTSHLRTNWPFPIGIGTTIGVSVKTLQNRERERRGPTGPGRCPFEDRRRISTGDMPSVAQFAGRRDQVG